ncbi:MAG: carboxypeptidase regulatory-like domain-containing protein, partial [Limisphaerales bacterium]
MRTCAIVILTTVTIGLELARATAWADVPPVAVEVQFVDSATGYALQPDEIAAQPRRADATEQRFGRSHTHSDGRAVMSLERVRHTISASLSSYRSVSGEVDVRENFPYHLRFLLDPLEKPRELQVDNIAARHRDDATLIQGFIVSEQTGRPLSGVRIESAPSGVKTTTDERGFYQLYVPLNAPANLVIDKPGYRTEERQYLELSPRGDWTYNFRLERGTGTQTLDERSPLRLAIEQDSSDKIVAAAPTIAPEFSTQTPQTPVIATNATLRIPRNIRVQDGTNIYYVTMNFYEKHTLPHEWIASWNTNSLNAGTVAVRCYAIARVNGRGPTTDYDICGDSNCQNFKATSSSTSTDRAVDYTYGYVVVNANGNVPSTEYSAENNSLGKPCGDGFAEPTSGCLYDPICAGHDRSGHGRGMCQRGTERWGGGGNGYPVRDWLWMIGHYYSSLTLVRGTELLIGDNIQSTSADCAVRSCGGGIDNGTLCPTLGGNKGPGQTGVIIGGPIVVTNDSKGFTWYQVRWNDGISTTGWSCENYLDRVVAIPPAPSNLTATPASGTQINLTWIDSTNIEAGFYVERAPASVGPWLEIAMLAANVTNYSDKNLYAGSTWYYRVRSYNSEGNSGYSAVASATTPNSVAPTLAPIQNKAVTPGTLVTFTNSATAPDTVKLITDFEAFQSETGNGAILFNTPDTSTSTSAFLNGAPEQNIAATTDTHPTGGQSAGNVLRISFQVTNAVNAWLRLTTAGATSFADPVIDLTKKLRFDIYSDQTVQVAAGCRETTTAAGTAIGSDGGTTGAIEWAGVTNIAGTAPVPTRTIASNTWTTVTFDFANEPNRNFSGGNGTLSTASGLGVLEHLAIVPKSGSNFYT